MRRFSSFRDFDWMLLTLVTADLGHQRARDQVRDSEHQVPRLRREADRLSARRHVLMFLISFVDYHRLIDIAPWAYGVGLHLAGGRQAGGHQGDGGEAMDQPRRRHPLSAVGVGQADPDPGHGAILLGSGRPRAELAGHRQGVRAGMRPYVPGAETAGPGNSPHLSARTRRWPLSRRNSAEADRDSHPHFRRARRRRMDRAASDPRPTRRLV